MRAQAVLDVLSSLSDAGCRAWVAGGWGVDALFGAQTREHRDLDLALDADDELSALTALGARGYVIETDWRPARVELAAAGSRWVDLHPVRFAADGHGLQADLDGGFFVYPPDCFVTGRIRASAVPCLSVDQQLRFREGYELRDVDRHDLTLLAALKSAQRDGPTRPHRDADVDERPFAGRLEAATVTLVYDPRMPTVFEAAGGEPGLLRLARAWHARVMADEVVSHAFSHGFHPEHSERLAAYWAEALGGPETFSAVYGDETSVVRMHSGNGPHEEMDRRAIACFDQALSDVGFTQQSQLAQVLHDYFAWATTTSMSRYHESAADVPDGLRLPRWSWEGPVTEINRDEG